MSTFHVPPPLPQRMKVQELQYESPEGDRWAATLAKWVCMLAIIAGGGIVLGSLVGIGSTVLSRMPLLPKGYGWEISWALLRLVLCLNGCFWLLGGLLGLGRQAGGRIVLIIAALIDGGFHFGSLFTYIWFILDMRSGRVVSSTTLSDICSQAVYLFTGGLLIGIVLLVLFNPAVKRYFARGYLLSCDLTRAPLRVAAKPDLIGSMRHRGTQDG